MSDQNRPEELVMSLFVLTYRYIDDAERVARVRPEHRAHLRELSDAGELVLAGPLGAPGPLGGLLIFDVDSAARVVELSDEDPFHMHGIVQERTVQPWTLSIGSEILLFDN
ncbi:YciI family protein [Gordonia sp. NPDC003376]